MIAGHLGVAMAARARWPRLPLLAIAVAALVPDIVDFATAALRICAEKGLYSHSLPAIAVEVVVLGGATALWRRSPAAGALVAAMIVLHLAADFITGEKLLWAGGPIVGLNLYDYPLADFVLETIVTLIGWRMLRSSAVRDVRAAAPLALALLLAGQAALDVESYLIGPLKPNGCPVSPLVQSSLPPGSGR